MKKKYTFLAAAILLSFAAFSQQNSNTNVGYVSAKTAYNNEAKTQLAVIGNPARGAVTLQISNPVSTKYELSLYSSTGTKVSTLIYDHPAGVSTKTIYVSQLQHGMYYLVVLSAEEKRSLNILVQ